ncbi:MAG TPA: DUF3108 domain-containing protein [Pyrinomonadaceae bacterium]|nr:DUF3108 domain-containing protein [Pyrinomonadaceae bacterium]
MIRGTAVFTERSNKVTLHHASTYLYHANVHPKLALSRTVLCLVVLLSVLTGAIAQDKPPVTATSFDASAYRVGERLTYNVSFAQFISAGHIELFVAGRGRYFDRDGIQLRAHAETSGVVNVALLSLNNDYTTYVDAATGLPYRSQQVVREAGRTTEVSSDYNQPAGTDAIPARLHAGGEFAGIFDLLSAIYRLRAMPLQVGESHSLNIRTESQDYQADVRVVGHELIKTNVGSFNALVARVKMSDSPIYNINVYLSNDEWHVPVLVTGRHDDGEIRAELAASELGVPAAPSATPVPTPVTPNPPRNVTTPPANAGAPLNLPFKVGEQLSYQVYLGTSADPVGSLTFAVTARGRYFNRDGLLFTVTAQTNSAGGRLFFVNDKILSYVDPETLLPFRTEMNLAEGKWRTTRAYTVDQNRGAVTTDKSQRIEIPVGTHDLISAIYAIRTFDLSPKRQNAISILAISQPRTLLVNSQQRETIELNGQHIPALLLTLSTEDTEKNGLQIRIWVGDDARHLPLRIAAVSPLGAVRADLSIKPSV